MQKEPYRQVLPDLELSLERFTDDVPDDGRWYLLRSGQEIGRFRSRKAAQEAWKRHVRESGWEPRRPELDKDEIQRREQVERWSRNRAG